MIVNRDLAAAWAYHDGTKHSFWSVRHSAHYLDWPNKPLPFKIYTQLDPIQLPREVPPLEMPALEAISATEAEVTGDAVPDLKDLVQVLYYSAGITKSKTYPGGEILFRAASCTGALYEIELYLVCGNLPDLEAGVYHFNPGDLALRRLRAGDYRGVMARATGQEPAVTSAPVTIICTGTYWRNAWKYQARTYRHFGWDNGTLLGNLLATATALKLPARVVMGFVDDEVNRLLSLDTRREVAFSLVALGRAAAPLPAAPAQLEPLVLETVPLSPREVDYPAMREMHAASSLLAEEKVREWRGHAPAQEFPEPAGELIPLRPLADDEMSRDGLGAVILRRGSTRQFARGEALGFSQFSTLLFRSMQGIPADFLDPLGAHLNELYLIVHAVEGLKPGAYVLHRSGWALELLKEGDFRAGAGYLGLEQDLPADGSAAIFFIADLKAALERFGNRGYRAAQLEAGMIGGKMYLAAYGLGFGATGLTFYDDDVIKFFSPHAEGKSAIFHVAVGKSMKRKLSVLGES
jgi:SagB-type dehydrogenase family enzyme